MASDGELNRLKDERDRAFQRMHDAYRRRNEAHEQSSAAHETFDHANDLLRQRREVQALASQARKDIRARNSPLIDSLNAQQENAYQNMRNAFAKASAAHERLDRATAREYADEGHRHKAEAQRYADVRRGLFKNIYDARDHYNAALALLQQAQQEFRTAKQASEEAKRVHAQAHADLEEAKKRFDDAVSAFDQLLQKIRAESERRKAACRSIAERAGVPAHYLDNVKISRQGNVYNIYFGGAGSPNGPGHGHYVMERNGKVTYKRDPTEAHGREERGSSLLYLRSARRDHLPMNTNEHGGTFYRQGDEPGSTLHITQYFADGYHVSWDATPTGNSNIHWTNQNLPKGHSSRFQPPEDAIL